MPNTYEKVEDDRVVERSVAFAGTTHDLQLSMAACNVDSPWFALDANGERVKLNPMPVFIAPSQMDTSADTPLADPPSVEEPEQVHEAAPEGIEPDTNEAAEPPVTDEPDESGDHTEE